MKISEWKHRISPTLYAFMKGQAYDTYEKELRAGTEISVQFLSE
jgi:hypothetical protein